MKLFITALCAILCCSCGGYVEIDSGGGGSAVSSSSKAVSSGSVVSSSSASSSASGLIDGGSKQCIPQQPDGGGCLFFQAEGSACGFDCLGTVVTDKAGIWRCVYFCINPFTGGCDLSVPTCENPCVDLKTC